MISTHILTPETKVTAGNFKLSQIVSLKMANHKIPYWTQRQKKTTFIFVFLLEKKTHAVSTNIKI